MLPPVDPPRSAASHPVIRLDCHPPYPDFHAVVPYVADHAGTPPHLFCQVELVALDIRHQND